MRPVHGLPDEAFLRGKAPMTKQEIRSVALSKLAPSADAVVCDIGAGTGSCTVELALQAPFGHVYAFEINEEALDVLRENIGHFDLSNVTVVAGDASQTLPSLDIVPDYAFIGGTKGNLAIILDDLYRKTKPAAWSSRPLPWKPWPPSRPIMLPMTNTTWISPRSARPAVNKPASTTS